MKKICKIQKERRKKMNTKNNLTKLVRQYKKEKNSKILEEIFNLLNKQLNQKAKYIFYKQNFLIEGKKCKLKELHRIDFEDIEQELKLTVLELIKNYNPRKPFENYLNHTLKFWFPKVMRQKEKRNELAIKNESEIYDEETETGVKFDNFSAFEPKKEEPLNLSKMFGELTKKEKRLIKLLIKNPNQNQSQLADRLRVSQMEISRILGELRDKYKKMFKND